MESCPELACLELACPEQVEGLAQTSPPSRYRAGAQSCWLIASRPRLDWHAKRQHDLRQSAGNDFHELWLNCRQGHQRLTRLIPSSVNRLRFTLLKVIRSAPVLSHLRPIAKRTSAVRPNARGWPSPGLHSAIGRHWNGAREMVRTDQEAIRFDDGKSHPAPHRRHSERVPSASASRPAIALPSLAAVHRDDKTSRLYRIITSHYAVFVAESDVNPQKCHIL